MSRSAVLSCLLGLFASALAAQAPGRLAMIEAWEHQHRHILAVIDSAGPGMLEFRTTPGVRTFAEQIDHIGNVAARIVAGGVAASPLPEGILPDTAGYLHDVGRLREQTDQVYRFVIATLSAMSDEQLAEDRAAFGGSMPRWRWNLTALQHSAWTLGQTVPYLRMNGRTPPQFTPF